MATATGSWVKTMLSLRSSPTTSSLRRRRPKRQRNRNHHYTFDVDDNGLDINGFIIQRYSKFHRRYKFRVYLDTNESGRFDRGDELIGMTGLKDKHSKKGIGNLLEDGELGQLKVKFKKDKSNESTVSAETSMAPAEPAEPADSAELMDELIDPALLELPEIGTETEGEQYKLNASMRGVGQDNSERNYGISSVRKLIFTDNFFYDQVAVIISEP